MRLKIFLVDINMSYLCLFKANFSFYVFSILVLHALLILFLDVYACLCMPFNGILIVLVFYPLDGAWLS